MSDKSKNLADKELKKELVKVGLRLQKYRKKANMSQFELGLESGVSQNMISFIESGNKNATLAIIFKLSKALGITPATLLQDETPEAVAMDARKAEIIKAIQSL